MKKIDKLFGGAKYLLGMNKHGFYLEEYQLNEIEAITGFTKSNIKVLLHRGRKNLYQHLERGLKNNQLK